MTDTMALSLAVEDLLTARNPRGMGDLRQALQPGYYLRAAQMLRDIKGTVLIGTGFPVLETFETDGPVGAIHLYQALEALGANPILVCGKPLSDVLAKHYRVHEITVGKLDEEEARHYLQEVTPAAIISIERPGLSDTGRYFNMRGEDISDRCACFDHFLELADCPSIAIGDGGNEIGMGNVYDAPAQLDIVPARTRCDELLIADVSNWAALGLIAILGYWQQQDLLATLQPRQVLQLLADHGCIDGVTRESTLTEDSLPVEVGESILAQLRSITGFGEKQ